MRDGPTIHDDLENEAQALDDLREKAMAADLPDVWIDKLREAASLLWDVANEAADV